MSYAVRKDGQGWRAVNSSDDCTVDETFSEVEPSPSQFMIDELAATESKKTKAAALNSITVTTTRGKTFDGNETARGNMLSAITASAFLGQTTANWKLADNTIVPVTLDELKEALALSIQRVGDIVTA